MTLVEVIVTIALIGVIVVPLARVFLESQATADTNSARQQALGLDTAILAKISKMNYAYVGLTSSDQTSANAASPGYSTGVTLVTLSAAPDLDGSSTGPAFKLGSQNFNVVLPAIFWGDRNFKVTTWAVWASSYVPACPASANSPATTLVTNAEKKVTVTASWHNPYAGWISATESTLVYPGGLAPYSGSETTPTTRGCPARRGSLK